MKLVFPYTNAWSRFLLEKQIVRWIVDKLCTFYQTQIFIMFAMDCHISQSNPCPPSCFLNMFFNVIHTSMPGSSKWCLSVKASWTKPLHNSFPHACYIPHKSHWSLKQYFVKSRVYESPHNIIFIPVLTSPFKPRYHSQHPFLKYPQPMFLPPSARSGLTPSVNIIVDRLWNWILCFVLKSSQFSQVFEEGRIYEQLLCQYQHRWLSVISSVYRNNLDRRRLNRVL